MRKSILIGALCVLMFLAFTACENENPMAGVSELVTKIEVTSATPTYFVSEVPSNYAGFNGSLVVTATTVGGGTFVVPTTQLTFNKSEQITPDGEEATLIGTVEYSGPSYSTVAEAEVYANVYTLDEIEVTAPSTAPVYYGVPTESVFDSADFVVTAVANDDTSGEVIYSRELTADDYEYAFYNGEGYTTSVGANAADSTSIGQVGVKFSFGEVESDASEAIILVQKRYLESFVASAKDGYVAIIGDAAGNAYDYVSIVKTYSNGAEETVNGSAADSDWAEGTLDDNPADTFLSTAATIEVTLDIGLTETESVQRVTITPVEDYVTGFTVSQGSITAGVSYPVSSAFSISTVTWASSGSTTTTSDITTDDLEAALLVNGSSSYTANAAGTYYAAFTIAGQPEAGTVYQSVTVTAAGSVE